MRNMSFALTTRQFLDGSKTVTRRLGWRFLKPGDRVRAVKKAMGLKPGEKIEPLGVIVIVDVRREPLYLMDNADCAREGFPEMHRQEFVNMFCKAMGCKRTQIVTRIEFKRID